ncbi:MAG: hypothetical protein AAFN77_19235 [Planctomycetota bacterium]
MIAELSGLNIVATEEARQQNVTLYLQNVRAIDAIDTVARVAGLTHRIDTRTNTIRIMTLDEFQDDIVIRRDDVTRVFTLLHPNAISVANAIQDLYGQRVQLNIRSFDDDILLQQGAALSSGIGFGAGARRGGNQGGFGGGGFGGGGFGGGGFGGGGFGGGGFGGGGFGGGGFGGRGFGGQGQGRNQQIRSIQEQLLDETLTANQLAALERQSQTRNGETTASEVSRTTQREQTIFVTLNRGHNLVMVRTGDQAALEEIGRLINEIDRPTPQVLLEMKIIEVTLDDNFRSIFDFQFVDGAQGPSAADQANRNPFLQGAANAAQNVLGLGNFPVEGGTFVYQFLNDNIRARIELLQTNGNIETVATPLLLASNNRSARIFVGEESVLVRSVNSNVSTGALGNGAFTSISPVTELVDVGTNLFIIPKINADRTVTLVINQDNSTINPGGATIPVSGQNGAVTPFPIDTIDTASVSGTVVAKDGLTVAIGGLIRETTNDNVQKVPGLGDLPVVGQAFRKTVRENRKTELVLLITPHVITTPIEGQNRSLERVNSLSSACAARDSMQPSGYGSGAPQPWSPRRLQEGYQRTVGEDNGQGYYPTRSYQPPITQPRSQAPRPIGSIGTNSQQRPAYQYQQPPQSRQAQQYRRAPSTRLSDQSGRYRR